MTEEQEAALKALDDALQNAYECGLLDVLNDYCDYTDSINDVCDAVHYAQVDNA